MHRRRHDVIRRLAAQLHDSELQAATPMLPMSPPLRCPRAPTPRPALSLSFSPSAFTANKKRIGLLGRDGFDFMASNAESLIGRGGGNHGYRVGCQWPRVGHGACPDSGWLAKSRRARVALGHLAAAGELMAQAKRSSFRGLIRRFGLRKRDGLLQRRCATL
jgi:hypothetical protein